MLSLLRSSSTVDVIVFDFKVGSRRIQISDNDLNAPGAPRCYLRHFLQTAQHESTADPQYLARLQSKYTALLVKML